MSRGKNPFISSLKNNLLVSEYDEAVILRLVIGRTLYFELKAVS